MVAGSMPRREGGGPCGVGVTNGVATTDGVAGTYDEPAAPTVGVAGA